MGSGIIRKDMAVFETAVKKLSNAISRQSFIWRDAQFAELTASVKLVADESRHLLEVGDQFCSAIDQFDAIASERY